MTNIVNSPAKNVRIDWNGLGEDGKIVINEQRKLPYAILGSGESLFVNVVLYGTDKRNPIIFLLWEDDYSKNNRKETSISFQCFSKKLIIANIDITKHKKDILNISVEKAISNTSSDFDLQLISYFLKHKVTKNNKANKLG